MIRITTSATHRRYLHAVATAERVPGLESELAEQRDQASALTDQHSRDTDRVINLEGELEKQSEAVQRLRVQLDSLESTVEQAAVHLAAAPPEAAAYYASRVFATFAEQLGLTATPHGQKVAEVLRDRTEVKRVHLLYRRGELKSAHLTEDAAIALAHQGGAAPDGWREARNETTHTEAQRLESLRADWCRASVTVDADTPWITPPGPLSEVFVVFEPTGLPRSAHSSEQAAIRAQDRAGIPHTACSLIRLPLQDPTAAAA